MVPPENFELWSRYEDLAMHFNGLLIQFRTQALAGLATLSTVAGYLIEKVKDTHERYQLLAGCSFAFSIAWTAAACLDLLYYSRLLEGSVQAILKLEHGSQIQMSSTIREEVGSDWPASLFYGLVLVALAGCTCWAWLQASRIPRAIADGDGAKTESATPSP